MLERAGIPTDLVSVLALLFGAAVMIPSVIALFFSLLAIGRILF